MTERLRFRRQCYDQSCVVDSEEWAGERGVTLTHANETMTPALAALCTCAPIPLWI